MNTHAAKTKSPWVPFLGLMFASFVIIEAMAFQLAVLPAVTSDFGIPIALAGLVALCYYLAHTVFGPIFGNIADQIGRKKIVVFGFSVFAAAEFLAALSPNFGIFLLARFIQGIGAACVIPSAIAYATLLFPKEKRGTAFGIYGAISAAGAAAGGLLGGYIVANYGWHTVYLFTGAISIVGLLVVLATLPETEKSERKAFDYVGSLLLLTSIALLLSVTMLIANIGIGSFYTIGALIGGISLFVIFWLYESKIKNPFLDVKFLKNPQFIMPLAIVLLLSIYFQGIIYSTAYFVTLKPDGGAQVTGVLTMFIYLSATLGGLVGGKVSDWFKGKSIILVCVFGYIAGLVMFLQFNIASPFWYISLTIAVLSGFNAVANVSAMKMAMNSVAEDKLGQGSGAYVMIRDLSNPAGQTTGLAVFGAISAASLSTAITTQATNAGVDEKFITDVQAAAQSAGQTVPDTLTNHLTQLSLNFMDLFNAAQLDGMILALNQMSIITLIAAVVPLVLAFLLPHSKADAVRKPKKNASSVEALVSNKNVKLEEAD